MAVTEQISSEDNEPEAVARRWCAQRGAAWRLGKPLGEGGTAPVFEIESPEGLRALKINSLEFSGDSVERERIRKQLELRGHSCPTLVQVYDGGEFEGRPYVLMSRAEGLELEKCLSLVPRENIRSIVDQVARAAIFLESRGLCHRDIKAANVFVSNDFSRATLLDISVIREIRDPIGIGTDHEGQLPIVATARYSPPEYLFRLLEPSPTLWHALTVYQLGALLHDLIMRESMFSAEYKASSQNRYRFAWIVATEAPIIEAGDVDEDLLILARRALDKDWRRRSQLSLEDFLSDAAVGRKHALELLGIGTRAKPPQNKSATRVRRVLEVCRELEQTLLVFLRENGVQARHRVENSADDLSKEVVFEWEGPPLPGEDRGQVLRYALVLSHIENAGKPLFAIAASLARKSDDDSRTELVELPPIEDSVDTGHVISREAERVLSTLAQQLKDKSPR